MMKEIKYPASNSGWTAKESIELARQCFNKASFGELEFVGGPVLTFGPEKNDIKITGTEQMRTGREIVVTWTANIKNGRESTSVTATAVLTILNDVESGQRYPWRVHVLLGKNDHTGHVQTHRKDEIAIKIVEQ
jgi:hypothetical protein